MGRCTSSTSTRRRCLSRSDPGVERLIPSTELERPSLELLRVEPACDGRFRADQDLPRAREARVKPRLLSLSPCDYANSRTTRRRAARWSLMPRGIAARYTTSATPTTEPNTSLEKRAFRAAAIQRGDKAVQAMVRYWCVNATAVESSACEAFRAGGPSRGSAKGRQLGTSTRVGGRTVCRGRARRGRPSAGRGGVRGRRPCTRTVLAPRRLRRQTRRWTRDDEKTEQLRRSGQGVSWRHASTAPGMPASTDCALRLRGCWRAVGADANPSQARSRRSNLERLSDLA